MHAFCLIAASPLSLEAAFQIIMPTIKITSGDDLTILGDSSIGINEIRATNHFLSTPPRGDFKVIHIPKSHTMTIPAMQALLKTVEEPPERTIILFQARQTSELLPTILSRCQIIYHQMAQSKANVPEEVSRLCKELETASPGKRLLLISPYVTKRETAITWCEQAVHSYRNLMLKKTHPALPNNVRVFQTAYDRLNANANVPLTLEHAVLQLQPCR